MRKLEDAILDLRTLTKTEDPNDKSKLPVVVRVESNYYEDSRGGLVMKRTARILKRKSSPQLIDYLHEDISNINEVLVEIMSQIKEDGLYKIDTIWHPGPWEYPEDGDVEWVVKKVKE